MPTLLPNARQTFTGPNGTPLSGGSVYFFIPNTTTPKATYQDSAQTILNPNPVILDANGQASIWGSGSYRQQVFDANANLIWDQITEDTSGGLLGNMTDNTFTASGGGFVPGTTTQLTLSSAPSSAANMWVYFDAVYQAPDSWSVSNTTVTFSAPIPGGVQEVNIKVGSTIAIGTPGSGTVTDSSVASNAAIDGSKIKYLYPSAGAVAITGAQKWSDIVSVKDFGAKGDGVTDDTAAIQAAINAVCPFTWQGSTRATELNGVAGSVYFPPGIYKATSKIRLAPGLHLLGANAATDYMSRNGTNGTATGGVDHLGSCIYSTLNNQTSYALDTSPWGNSGVRRDDYLQAASDSSNGVSTQVQGVVIENMTLAGNWTCRGLNLAGADTFRLENVFIKGFNVGVRCSAVWYGRAENVTIESNYRSWINAIGCTDVQIDNCAFRNGVDGVTYTPSVSGREASDPPTTTDLTQAMLDQNIGIVTYYATISGDNTALENFQTAILSSNAIDHHTNIYVEGITDTVLRIANYDGQNGYYHFDTINPNGASCNLLWCSQARVEIDCNWTNYTPGNYNKLIGFLNAPSNNRALIPVFNARFSVNAADTLSTQFWRKRPDDYQEGTWNPSLSFGGNSAGTQTTTYGSWHRIGSRVFCDFTIGINTLSGATGSALISGLPFNADTTANHYSFGVVGLANNSPAGMLVQANSGTAATVALTSNAGTSITNSGFSNGMAIAGSFSYQVQSGT